MKFTTQDWNWATFMMREKKSPLEKALLVTSMVGRPANINKPITTSVAVHFSILIWSKNL